VVRFCYEINGVFGLGLAVFVVVIIMPPLSAGGDEPYTEEGHGTAADEFTGIVTRGAFEVAIQDGRSENHGKCEEDELYRYDLRGVEALEGSVDVLDLHNCCTDQDGEEEIEDWECDHTPEGIG
jgi:hypothetical protein